ncbi:PorV/PorQ family protein [bacterium]|nr:MAG: PorV/PorQ family protein [bacterium]
MKTIFKSLLIVLVLMLAGQELGHTQSITKAGISAGQFLRIHVGARGSAMGGAVAGDVSDLTSMFWNPAGLADVKGSQVLIEQGNMYVDLTHNFLAASAPMGNGVLGVSVTALTMGDFYETTYDNPEGTGRIFNAYMYSVGLSYSMYLIPDFKIGFTGKLVNETISYSSATGLAFDIGTIYRTPFDGIRFGVSVTNIGLNKMQMDGEDLITTTDLDDQGAGNYEPDSKLVTDPYDLPLMLRVGFAYDAFQTEQFRATFTVDGTVPSDNVQSVSIGTEMGFLKDLVQLRAGLPYLGLKDRVEQFSAGIGVKYPVGSMKMQFGYSYQAYNYLNPISRISIGIQF